MGTDGLWDNLFVNQVLDLMRPFVRVIDDIADPGLVAELIASEANKYSKNNKYLSPFAKEAYRFLYDYMGGKPDDITVVVAQVIKK